MIEITAKIDGMMCGHCEAHVNDVIRTNFPVKKVSSDHRAGVTTILTETNISDAQIEAALAPTGYHCLESERHEKQSKGLFGFMRK